MALNFFGLSDKYMKNVHQMIFHLVYAANFDWYSCYTKIPSKLREFYYQALITQKEEENKAIKKNSKKGKSK
jgi:hypothetical protein